MDDRQRQFAQFATALNQYAGNGDRGSRDRTAPDGRSSTGSTSSGSSNGSGNAAAALWGELGRAAFPFNYSGWPQPHQGGGAEYHRYGSYGGFNDNSSENRNAMESRPEGRRVPSKGETKATPPLPPGLSAGIGSTLASLQQLVGLPNEDVYRSILAQQYAAAAALSGMPPSTRSSMSPIPPSNHSTISPSQHHGTIPVSSARHHQQQMDKHIQQQYHLQRSRQQQQSKSPPAIPLLTTIPGTGHSSTGTDSSMNGEYLEPMSRGQSSQLSPMTSRKERLLEHNLESFQTMRPSHNPTPPKSTSISPIDRLTPSQVSDRQHHFSSYEDEGKLQELSMRVSDIGARSGSESEGDQRARHKRKQDQPRRQSVIYSSTVHSHQISGNAQQPISAVSADSSSEDSQDYDSLLHPPSANDAAKESIRNSSPLVSVPSDPLGNVPSTISQAMSHVLSHPFVAAHLNASSLNSYGEHKHAKKEANPSQYRNEYGVSSPHSLVYKNDLDASYNAMKEKYSPQYRGDCKANSLYSNKDGKNAQSYYRNEKEAFDALDFRDRSFLHQSSSNSNVHSFQYDHKNNRPSQASHYEPKSGAFHSEEQLPSPQFTNRDERLYNSQFRNETNDMYYQDSEDNSDLSNYRFNNKISTTHLSTKEQRTVEATAQFLPSDSTNRIKQLEMNIERVVETSSQEDGPKPVQSDYCDEQHKGFEVASKNESTTITAVKQSSANTSPKLSDLISKEKQLSTRKSIEACKPNVIKVSDNKVEGMDNQSSDDKKMLDLSLPQPSSHLDNLTDKDNTSKISHADTKEITVTDSVNSLDFKNPKKVAELSEPLINGDIQEASFDDGKASQLTPSVAKMSCDKVKEIQVKSIELFNGDHDQIMSPSKKNKKKDALTLSPNFNENKRQTRQKRPVSYVEDETDPVLEMNEDMPLLSPAKKRGRKCKEKNDSGHEDCSLSSPPLSGDSKNINSGMSSPNFDDGDQSRHLPRPQQVEENFAGDLQVRQRALECSQIPPNISVPLHIDTSTANNYNKPDVDMPCPTSITPILHSPDIYDFNDIDGEGGGRGSKKRGRKRGSPKKVGRATPEYLRSSLSPRMRDSGTCNKSPKFFTSNRIPESLERLRIGPLCNDNGSKLSYIEFSNKSINSETLLQNNMAPPNSISLANPLVPLPLLPNSSSIVDEVEMQLAALHKEHIADAENRRTNTPDRSSLKVEGRQTDPAAEVKAKEPVVMKPMLSVVPLDQLTYEGMRKKNLANSEAYLKSNEVTIERICKDPISAFLGSECLPSSESNLIRIAADHDLEQQSTNFRKEPRDVDRAASPSSSASSFTAVEEKSELDLSENIHIYNENFDSEGERNVIYTKMISRENCESRLNKCIFPSDSPSSRGSTPKNIPEDVFKDKGSHNLNTILDSHLLDSTAANITFIQPNTQFVAVAEIPSSVVVSGRPVRGARQRRRGGRRRSNVSDSGNIEEPALNDSSLAVPSTESNHFNNFNEQLPIDTEPRLRRRGRRSANHISVPDISVRSSPPPLDFIPNNRPNSVNSLSLSSNTNLLDRVPPHYPNLENLEMDLKTPQNHAEASLGSCRPNCLPTNHSEAETLEDIAKFLEDTAPSLESKSPSRNPAASTSNQRGCETSYKDARPKRVSRPPPEMNDKEVNDLLLLLNMDDEESEDEDYTPKGSEELDTTLDSEDHGSIDDESDNYTDGDSEANLSGDITQKKRNFSGASIDKEAQSHHLSAKKRREESPKNKKCSSSNRKLVKGKPESLKKKDDSKRKWEDKYDCRGPLLRYSISEKREIILNAPDRNYEQERNKQFSIPFHVDAKMGKVGFSSTLHNSYDAFNKDLSWFCAFCKNYSHYRTLGDLFGPFFIKGLKFSKKTYPEVFDGQVSESSLSPHLCFSADGFASSKSRIKKTPKHESSDHTGDSKKIEVGSISPPVRFVPSATPARMLVGRGGATPRDNYGGLCSPRIPISSPSSSTAGPSHTSTSSQSASTGSDAVSEQNKNQNGTECWLHEECILWSSGVTVVNSRLCGLEEAVIAAQESICSHCGETGATVCCLGKGCSTIVHVPCARLLMWSFSIVTFQSFCPKHSVSKGCTNPKGKSSRKL